MKVVFCDLDGTLLHENKDLSPQNKYAIHALAQKGIPFVIATGRGATSVYTLLDEIGLDVDCIVSNGTYMERKREKVFSFGFTWQEAKNICDKLDSMGISYSIFSEKLWISPKRDENVQLEERLVGATSQVGTIEDIDKNRCINKIMAMMTPEVIDQNQAILKEAFPNFSIMNSLNYLLEITQGTHDKGTAVQDFCKHFNVAKEDTVGFGDSYIDAPMLRAVGTPYVMQNGVDEVKQEFGNIILSNDEDGVYHQLVKLGWIDEFTC